MALFQRDAVVGRLPGNNDPAVHSHHRNDRIDHRIAEIVELDVDTLRAGRCDRPGEIALRLVVDRRIEAGIFRQPRAFRIAARNPGQRRRAPMSGKLARGRANGAGGGADEDRVAPLKPPDALEAEVRGHPGNSQDAQEQRCRNIDRRQLDRRAAPAKDAVRAPGAAQRLVPFMGSALQPIRVLHRPLSNNTQSLSLSRRSMRGSSSGLSVLMYSARLLTQ